MQKRFVTAAAVALLALGTATSVLAQGGFGRGMMFGGGPMGNNPTMSAAMALLQRPEVQSELHLDLKQKNALEGVRSDAQGMVQQRIQQFFQNNPDLQNLRNMSPEERRAKFQELMPQIQSQMQQFLGELNDKVKGILRPDQMARLHELDLQYRGALALADPKVAEEVKLSQEHRSAVTATYTAYQQQVQQAMQALFQGQQPGQGGPPDPAQIQQRVTEMQTKNASLKKEGEEKALALLSDEEKQRWTAALGKPFTFRKDQPGPRGA